MFTIENSIQLPTSNFQRPTTPNAQLPIERSWESGVGNWEWLALGVGSRELETERRSDRQASRLLRAGRLTEEVGELVAAVAAVVHVVEDVVGADEELHGVARVELRVTAAATAIATSTLAAAAATALRELYLLITPATGAGARTGPRIASTRTTGE